MRIHVVSFQVPFPADYGGVIDVYYKLKALQEAGFEVVLHSFAYRRGEAPSLLNICKEVHYYPRELGWRLQCSWLPYIVNTRRDKQLLENLCQDDAPILFEGLHTCYYLNHPRLRGRKKIVRMHNIEHEYYWRLALQHKWNWRAMYYAMESIRLRWFEKKLVSANLVAAITEADKQQLEHLLPQSEIITLPCFFDTNCLEMKMEEAETRPFVLYHGNLAVEENIRAVDFILKEIAPQLPTVSFVVAGRNPDFKSVPQNVEIVANPTDEALDKLLSTAQIHLLLTFQPTGIKLKLLNALAKGNGHVIANHQMLHGHSLGDYCTRVDQLNDIITAIQLLINQPLSQVELENRRKGLLKIKKAGISRLSLFK